MSDDRKVAVIAGASQGIGAGLVRGFLDRGYRVVANPFGRSCRDHLRGAAERDVRMIEATDQ